MSHTQRYVLTEKGRLTITAPLAAQEANTQELTELAASMHAARGNFQGLRCR
jgi:hypothetical protein